MTFQYIGRYLCPEVMPGNRNQKSIQGKRPESRHSNKTRGVEGNPAGVGVTGEEWHSNGTEPKNMEEADTVLESGCYCHMCYVVSGVSGWRLQ